MPRSLAGRSAGSTHRDLSEYPEAGTAWVLIVTMALLIRLLKFVHIQRLLLPPIADPTSVPTAAVNVEGAHRVARAMTRAARRAPGRTDCYPQALAASLMLRCRRVPHVLLLGVRRGTRGSLEAHAWVVAGSVSVTGGVEAGRHTATAAFPWPAGRAT